MDRLRNALPIPPDQTCKPATSTDIITGDTVTFTPTTATFNNKNVGTNKAVSITGVQLGGTDGNNYALTSNTGSATANITAKSLTAAFTTTTKEYDGTTAATVVGNSTQIAGTDVVTIASTSASFNKPGCCRKPLPADSATVSSSNSSFRMNSTCATSGCWPAAPPCAPSPPCAGWSPHG